MATAENEIVDPSEREAEIVREEVASAKARRESPKDEPAAETKPESLTPAEIAEAKSIGFDDEDIAATSPRALRKALGATRKEPGKPTEDAGKPAEAEADPGDDAEDEFLDERAGKEIAKLRRELADIRKAHAAATDPFDALVEASGLPETFGKGPSVAMDGRTSEARNRARLREAVEVLKAGYAKSGKAVDDRELFDRAIRLEFPEAKETSRRKAVEDKAALRERQLIARTDTTRDVPASREDRAVRRVAAFLADRGVLG
jgi:hypothetical protein